MSWASVFLRLTLLLPIIFAVACGEAPPAKDGAPAGLGGAETSNNLILKKGMRIKLRQLKIIENGESILSRDPAGWSRTVIVENPSGAEGLSFEWHLDPFPAESMPEFIDSARGKMTLANLVGARRMTLPLFWPGGELFLSNSSAIWLSDAVFSELQKQGKTAWSLGVLDNALLGPAQGEDLLESALALAQLGIEAKENKKSTSGELIVTDKSADFRLKVNGAERQVEIIEAGNWLVQLKILKNPQNPLILEVEVAPDRSLATQLFLPLSWVRDLLSYQVEEIILPQS